MTLHYPAMPASFVRAILDDHCIPEAQRISVYDVAPHVCALEIEIPAKYHNRTESIVDYLDAGLRYWPILYPADSAPMLDYLLKSAPVRADNPVQAQP